ncbi:hypothetical protein TREES_T100000742 [Tupaia chinensis]|uniref:Uncharacterized protein n=1 Tax=Tupaia chinensis TaxID=246437 RepID=L9KJS5_TUPCH|nr:hypothetical protein TREES_T100000742 [Tupaia chinensis]
MGDVPHLEPVPVPTVGRLGALSRPPNLSLRSHQQPPRFLGSEGYWQLQSVLTALLVRQDLSNHLGKGRRRSTVWVPSPSNRPHSPLPRKDYNPHNVQRLRRRQTPRPSHRLASMADGTCSSPTEPPLAEHPLGNAPACALACLAFRARVSVRALLTPVCAGAPALPPRPFCDCPPWYPQTPFTPNSTAWTDPHRPALSS